MKKGSTSRKCGKCRRIVFWIIPVEYVLGLRICTTKTIIDYRYVKENPDGSGHYYCMDCLRKMFPGKY